MDGIDLWPLLTGATASLERQTLLYFQNVYLECGRWKNWKLHVSRANTLKWSPAPPGGVLQLMLPRPELYDLSIDPDESYDVAHEHPEVVKRMLADMETALRTFPPDIRKAWDDMKARKAAPVDAGNVPPPPDRLSEEAAARRSRQSTAPNSPGTGSASPPSPASSAGSD